MADLFKAAPGPVLTFVVPGEVRGWGRAGARIVKFKDPRKKSFISHYTKPETKDYEARIAQYALQARVKSNWGPMRLSATDRPLRMDVVAYIPIPKSWSKKERAELDGQYSNHRIDADNIYKAIADACHNILYDDDKMLAVITCAKRWVADPTLERLQVRVAECG